MNFRTELHINPLQRQIAHNDKIGLIGSCFTEHMTGFLAQHKFRVLENPHGILFNPVSIANALQDYVACKKYEVADLFQHEGVWYSWHHHGRFASVEADVALSMINKSIRQANDFLTESNWAIITLGSAWVYHLSPNNINTSTRNIVANCHKVAASQFGHRLLSVAETVQALMDTVDALKALQSNINIIFTISPVRHAREGLVENNQSKSVLHVALQQLLSLHSNCHYFPAYELVIDDLRDYRFYAEDMVHPNYQATRYVWEKFRQACIQPSAFSGMDEAFRIVTATRHKALYPASAAHQEFLQQTIKRATALQLQHLWMNFNEEIAALKNGLLV